MKVVNRLLAQTTLVDRIMHTMSSRVFLWTMCGLLITSSVLLFGMVARDINGWLNGSGDSSLQSNGYVIVNGVDEPATDSLKSQRKHVVIFDGGSTGTRIHVFTFQIKPQRETNLIKHQRKRIILKSEDFKSITPGLSSYAESPEEAANSVRSLLSFAGEIIPDEHRPNTSLSLIATAGLRLLPDKQSVAILDSIEEMLHTLDPSYKLGDDSIKILDGNSEGIFAWVTINFLLKRIHNPRRSVAVLDLGGGSTQITFAPRDQQTIDSSPNHFLIQRDILGRQELLYTHSYLGYGLMAARQALLLRALDRSQSKLRFAPHDHVNVSHPCFQSGQTRSWNFQYVTYSVTGTGGDCYNFVHDYFVQKSTIQPALELNDREIYAVSYYYDRMADVGLINRSDHLGQVSIRDLYLAARHVCGEKFDLDRRSKRFKQQWRLEREATFAVENNSEFLCFDLTYITHLLHTGFGIRWNKQITLGKRLQNVELSWALGAAFSMLDVD